MSKKKAVDLSSIVDVSELTLARRSLDRRAGGDRFNIADVAPLKAELAAEDSSQWFAADLADISETGCGFFISSGDFQKLKTGSRKKLLGRIIFTNGRWVELNFTAIRITEDKSKGVTSLGCLVDGDTPAYDPFLALVKLAQALTAYELQMGLKRIPVDEDSENA